MYDVAWKRALMTPMLCLTFYHINTVGKKKKKKLAERNDHSTARWYSVFSRRRFRSRSRCIISTPRLAAAAAIAAAVAADMAVHDRLFCMYGSFRNGAGGSVKRLAVHASL